MKFLRLLIFTLLLPTFSNAQEGYIYTVVGNGTAGFNGDGGLAINAQLNTPISTCIDNSGNLYIADMGNNRIRKVDAVTKIITTVAGNGTPGFSGDGGPAINASLNNPYSVTVDDNGNIYVADKSNNRIRKIDASGTISTFVGNGTSVYSGDGGPAANAGIAEPTGVATDIFGNVFIADQNGRIRKVTGNGIINTIAGGGTVAFTEGAPALGIDLCLLQGLAVGPNGDVYFSSHGCSRFFRVDPAGNIYTLAGIGTGAGYSGDGGPANMAMVGYPYGVAADPFGNVYITPQQNIRVRRIDGATNIITTVAGNGVGGFSGDGGLATNAQLSGNLHGLCSDQIGNIFLPDVGNNRVRLIVASTDQYLSSDSFRVHINKSCAGPSFVVITDDYNVGMTVKTYFGDGTNNTNTVLGGYVGGHAVVNHDYSTPGIYSVKQVLYYGVNAVDSIIFAYQHAHCATMSVRFYYDINSDCVYDPGTENYLLLPIQVEVDSASVPIDTISCTSGFVYTAYGNVGDIYSFKIISQVGDIVPSCPVTGIVNDTLLTGIRPTQYVALGCNGINSFDLGVDVSLFTAANRSDINMIVSNTYCIPQNGILKMTFSPKYSYFSSSHTPVSQTANSISWNVNNLSAFMSQPAFIYTRLAYNGQLLTPGDTVNTKFELLPIVGDINPANNIVVRDDTVTGPYDPNAVHVSPSGCVVPGTRLQYTVTFENMGNAPAENIYIMDTLSLGVEMSSMKLLAASHEMIVTKIYDLNHNILKFEFPNINLPDSSSPAKHGMVMYTIDMVDNFPIGSAVTNKAGIFFDYMPVVLTNVTTTGACWPASVNETNATQSGITIYPNPATEQLTIKTEKQFNSYSITNTVGQVMLQHPLDSKEAKADIRQLAAGIYYLHLEGENGAEVRKFVKM